MPAPDILSVASRRAIYTCVKENPGAHLREITRRCDLPLGTTLYHLDYLDANGLVVSRRDGRYKRYFVSNAMGRREKELLSAFRHNVPRHIITVLLTQGLRTQRELCQAIGVSRSTLSFHVNNLIKQGIVRRTDDWPERRYAVEEPDLARALLLQFRQSLAEADPHPIDAMLDALAGEQPVPVAVAAPAAGLV